MTNPPPAQRLPYGLAAAAGAAVWLCIALLSGRREAWDSGLYWTCGMPVLMAASGWLGWKFPAHPWRWPLTAFAAQALVLFVMKPGGNLLPLGLIAFLVLSLPCVLAAWIGSMIRGRRG
ncbi:MAG: hypothetical protein HY922_00780 [Elusimicrobia bacterium]|nr:hypothetical protein [Elusimicrobiota bacterium]